MHFLLFLPVHVLHAPAQPAIHGDNLACVLLPSRFSHCDNTALQAYPPQLLSDNSCEPALAKIETLKSYGFTLAEVKELLLLPETELAHRIHVRRISAYAQLNEMRRVIRRMEAAIVQMEGTSMANDTYHVILMQAPAQKVFSVRRTIQIGEMHDLFAELRAQMKRAGVRRTGPTQARYHGEEFSYEHMDVEAQAAVDADGPNVSVIPAGTFAAVTHTGPYENIKYAYDALCGWVAHHPEYKVCGPAIERYIKDEAMVHDPEELETGVLFPVCRAEE